MKYILSENFRVDFTAYAPMHTFKGWAVKGIDAEMEIDFDALELKSIRATAETRCFDTGKKDRNLALQTYMDPDYVDQDYIEQDSLPRALVEMVECTRFEKMNNRTYKISLFIILEFMGIRKQMPVIFIAIKEKNKIIIDVELKWSFKAYGLKAPRLLFLAVKDIVDIKGKGEFNLVEFQ